MIRLIIITTAAFWLSACGSSVRYSAAKPDTSGQVPVVVAGSLDQFVQEWTGTPYLSGGMARNGVDCSGFTSMLYRSVYKISLPRQAADQYRAGQSVRASAMQKGDLVFFRNITRSGIDHVGVFLGDGRFVHASVSSGVIISELGEEYYRKRFAGARRYF